LCGILGMMGYCTIERFEENRWRSVTAKRRAAERSEQWEVIQKHFNFEDPDFRSKFYADLMTERENKPSWRRGWWSGPIDNLMDAEKRKTLGGWEFNKWIDKVSFDRFLCILTSLCCYCQAPVNTKDKASHDAYNELLELSRQRIARRTAARAPELEADALADRLARESRYNTPLVGWIFQNMDVDLMGAPSFESYCERVKATWNNSPGGLESFAPIYIANKLLGTSFAKGAVVKLDVDKNKL